MRKLEIVAAVFIVIAAVLIMNTCSSSPAPTTEDPVENVSE